jgi:hypothetical protein
MESQNKALQEANNDASVFTPSKPRLGIVGLILGISGAVISLGSFLLFYFILLVGGGLDIMDYPAEEFTAAGYFGLFVGITGGVLGVMSLRQGENKTAASVSIILAILLFCTCSLLTVLVVIPSFL